MAPLQEGHHHRNTTKVSHKPFKSKHATKNLLRDQAKGKLDKSERGSRKTPHQQMMSKLGRKNQARQQRKAKYAENFNAAAVFAGHKGAPRIISVVALSPDVDVARAIRSLNEAVGIQNKSDHDFCTRIDRFRQNVHYLPVKGNLLNVLDACRIADYVICIFSSTQELENHTDQTLRAIESQGVSNILTMVQDLDGVGQAKNKSNKLSHLKSYISRFFPGQEKVLSLDNESECANAVRSFCNGMPKGIRWREDRSWMLIEDVRWPENQIGSTTTTSAVITGFVRGRGLKPSRLVQIGDWGSFQIEKITKAPPRPFQNGTNDSMVLDQPVDSEDVVGTPGEDQEDMSELAPFEASMEDIDAASLENNGTEKKGVLLDDHHYFSDDETNAPQTPNRLPKGTSSYQTAWFLGDMSDPGSDGEDDLDIDEDISMDVAPLPQDGIEGLDRRPHPEPTEGNPSEYPRSEMFVDPSPDDEADQLAAYRAQRGREAEEDLEFPDEIELHPNVLARERLARYRGLKSLKTSKWEMSEDRAHEPEDWDRLLQIPDYKRSRKYAENDALVDGVPPGTRVNVHLRDVPLDLHDQSNMHKPVALYSLLRHEQKKSVINMSMTLRSDYPRPLKSKCELVVQCGSRRMAVNPVFSQSGTTPNDVHKFLRYLHPGQTAIVSFIAPVTWGPVPVLFFEPSSLGESSLELIATGTCLPASTSRVIAKRVILTGHPYKIHKKLVTVRYMFFNAEDIDWFKALPLWTKRGRSGFIKESLGTHGYFKATFDARINPQDAVGVSLYKRVWPRQARPWNLT